MNTTDYASVKKAYDHDGYAFLPAFLSEEEITRIREELNTFIAQQVPGMPPGYVFYEDKSDPATLKQLQDMHRYSPFFEKMLEGSRFEELAAVLLDDTAVPKNIEYFNKPAHIGKATPPHQDGYYFMLKPVKAITMWLALEPADETNGCVRYIKGSHLKPMRPHGRTQTLGFSQGITDYSEQDKTEEVFFPAKAGDLLVHDAMTIHRTDPNGSARSRKALGFIYFGASAKEDLEAKAAYQQRLHEERFEKNEK
ncbi:phytanoyl-CoA dioxygenase family protein [Niabella beijingensis]|uniref:phytanoyl-CoA dioxygenase family protein n=1 Tax=Niabella beijingensis TaxID=2872700 RepID=UPI001CC175A3|nr:phytanoyl-CoA dioxygenase family protein [Niabella beijingensis]MBZ4190892.1 phytanoyl-CoA dioxygenase family protein [Niabella beijingensis]